VQSEGISLRNIHIILEFSLAIPGTSTSVQRVFSITNALWTDEKNSFLVETIKAVIVTKTHFQDLSCNDFYSLILRNPKYCKKFVRAGSTEHLPKRRNQLLQHQMEINCKQNSVSVNENL
jgi:hypothetical protein